MQTDGPTPPPPTTPAAVERLLLSPDETATALGLSTRKVYELLASGQIPSIKIGALRRVPVHALRETVQAWQQDDRKLQPGGASGEHSGRRP